MSEWGDVDWGDWAEPNPAKAIEMEAFDKLPPRIQETIRFGPFPQSGVDLRDWMAKHRASDAKTSAFIREVVWPMDTDIVAAKWKKKYKSEYPPVAAEATRMFTDRLAPNLTGRPRRARRRIVYVG